MVWGFFDSVLAGIEMRFYKYIEEGFKEGMRIMDLAGQNLNSKNSTVLSLAIQIAVKGK